MKAIELKTRTVRWYVLACGWLALFICADIAVNHSHPVIAMVLILAVTRAHSRAQDWLIDK